MKTRIATGFCITAVIALFFFFGKHYHLMKIGLSIISVVGASELFSITKEQGKMQQDIIMIFCAYICLAVAPWLSIFSFVRIIIIVANIVLLLRFIFSEHNCLELLSYIYLIFIFWGGSLFAFNYYYEQDIYYMLFFMMIAYGSDIFAYFVGYFFGENKLIPWVSPQKTVEGMLGGILGSIIMVEIVQRLYLLLFKTQVPLFIDVSNGFLLTIVMVVVLSVFSQCGDLFFSKIKRYFQVKDYGGILPGHGGIIDRADSLVFVVVIFTMLQKLLQM